MNPCFEFIKIKYSKRKISTQNDISDKISLCEDRANKYWIGEGVRWDGETERDTEKERDTDRQTYEKYRNEFDWKWGWSTLRNRHKEPHLEEQKNRGKTEIWKSEKLRDRNYIEKEREQGIYLCSSFAELESADFTDARVCAGYHHGLAVHPRLARHLRALHTRNMSRQCLKGIYYSIFQCNVLSI